MYVKEPEWAEISQNEPKWAQMSSKDPKYVKNSPIWGLNGLFLSDALRFTLQVFHQIKALI